MHRDVRRAAVRTPDPLTALEQTVAEGLQLQADMLAALPRDADGLTASRRQWALAPAFDVLLQLMPVLKALGSPQGALQVSVAPHPACRHCGRMCVAPSRNRLTIPPSASVCSLSEGLCHR